MTARRQPCDRAFARARLGKSEQFGESAETIRELADEEADVGDAYVTLCVHAGIAAADAICCTVLGYHAQVEDQAAAVEALSKAGREGKQLGNALRVLLGMKTRAGYGAVTVNSQQRTRAGRRAMQLIDAARLRVTSV